VPDDQDYEDLKNLLAHAERWTESEAAQARGLRQLQAVAAPATISAAGAS